MRSSRPLGCASFHHFNSLGVELKERVKHVWLQLKPMITAISPCPQVDLVAVETGVKPVAEVGLCFHLLPLLSSPLRTANGVIYLLHPSTKSRMLPDSSPLPNDRTGRRGRCCRGAWRPALRAPSGSHGETGPGRSRCHLRRTCGRHSWNAASKLPPRRAVRAKPRSCGVQGDEPSRRRRLKAEARKNTDH
jgi:hypothetical protein